MADWNAAAALQAVKNLILAVRPGTVVTFGSPTNVGGRVLAYLCLLPTLSRSAATSGLRDRTIRIFVGIGYRLDPNNPGAAEAVELQVAQLCDLFLNGFETDRSLGGAISGGSIEEDLTRQPTYAAFATQEFRVVPFIISGVQTKTFAI
jgi:hypothetical protein